MYTVRSVTIPANAKDLIIPDFYLAKSKLQFLSSTNKLIKRSIFILYSVSLFCLSSYFLSILILTFFLLSFLYFLSLSFSSSSFVVIYLVSMHLMMFFILYYNAHHIEHGCDPTMDALHRGGPIGGHLD